MNNKPDENRRGKKLRNILIVAAVIVLYAYATKVTDINLEEPLRPRRQANLISLIRDLARPDLFSFEGITRATNISLRMPCPEEVRGSQVTNEDRNLVLVPNCVNTTQDVLRLEGTGFAANVEVTVLWYPPDGAGARRVANIKSNSQGQFSITFTMPDVRESDAQRLAVVEVLERRITGISAASKITFERIIETILMALMASTIGTFLAIPISFLAARNLMANVGTPVAAIMSAIIGALIGGWIGWKLGTVVVALAIQLTSNLLLGLGAFIILLVVLGLAIHLKMPLTKGSSSNSSSTIRYPIWLVVVFLLALVSLSILAHLGVEAGLWLSDHLGFFGFIGNFLLVAADFARVTLPITSGLLLAVVFASNTSRYGQEAVLQLEEGSARLVTLATAFFGTAILIYGLVYIVLWICLLGVCRQLPDTWTTYALPAVVGGLVASLLVTTRPPKKPFPVGTIIYTITRGVLNVLRAIEPIIMGIVFVVWVGIGPFAGILALMLHSIADLGKLFSEQVENIDEGPLEAVTATGANRYQMIRFAVIPQVVPHYIAFIFYRWDINVRLSTIIGFVGGGGIGLVLQRHTNLLQYRQASVMVIAIAIVVTLLDNVSSRIRRRII
jgi:phosphonate ABC transporter permease subunit PhnE